MYRNKSECFGYGIPNCCSQTHVFTERNAIVVGVVVVVVVVVVVIVVGFLHKLRERKEN